MAKPGKFQFPLARVLSVREIERRLAASRLAEATARVRDAAARHRSALQAAGQLEKELACLRAQSRIDVTACLSVEALLEAARAAAARCAVDLAAREAEREATLAAHAEAHRKVKTLDRLEEIRRAEHSQARRVAESKTMDEVASTRRPDPSPDPSPLPSPGRVPSP